MPHYLRRFAAPLCLLAMAATLGGCIVVPVRPGPSPGWCYWHPHACH